MELSERREVEIEASFYFKFRSPQSVNKLDNLNELDEFIFFPALVDMANVSAILANSCNRETTAAAAAAAADDDDDDMMMIMMMIMMIMMNTFCGMVD